MLKQSLLLENQIVKKVGIVRPNRKQTSRMKLHPISAYLAPLCVIISCLVDCRSIAAGENPSPSGERGILAGVVSNQATGSYLESALVKIDGTNLSSVTDQGGTFSIPLAAGTYTLSVNYVGLDTARISVTVVAGAKKFVEVSLTNDIYKLERFSVVGLREGTALAIQRQREAENAKTVVATDVHGAPASNPGELLGRIPGVTVDRVGDVATMYIRGLGSDFISMMVDGNNIATSVGSAPARSFNLRAFGTSNIESAEVVRAPTPDMPANAVAGYVNLISRRAFDRTERTVTFTMGGMNIARGGVESPHRQRFGGDIFAFKYADALSVGKGKRNLGIDFSLSHQQTIYTSDGTTALAAPAAVFALPTATNGLTTPLRASFGSIEFFDQPLRLRTVGLSVDYKLTERSAVYLRNTYNENGHPHSTVSGSVRWDINTTAAAASFAPGSSYDFQTALPIAASTSQLISTRSQRLDSTYAVSGGYTTKLFSDESGYLDLDLSLSSTKSVFPSTSQIRSVVTNIGWTLDRREAPSWFPNFAQTSGPSIYEANNYRPTTLFRASFRGPAQRYGLRLNFRKDLKLGVPAYFKTGIRYERDTRKQDNERVNYTYAAASPTGVAPFVDQTYRITGGHYGPFPFIAVPTSGGARDIAQNRALWMQTAADAYNDVQQSLGSDSKFTENISSAYLMGGTTLGKLRIMAGVRAEKTEDKGTAFQTVASSRAGTDSVATLSPDANRARAVLRYSVPMRTTDGSYANVFPGVHFIMEPLAALQVRASYNKSISRPAIGSLLPVNNVNDVTQVVTAGNPELRPFTSDNLEVSVQKYFEPIGLFEVSAFLKQISNYSRTITTVIAAGSENGFDGNYAGYTLSSPVNTGDARVRGFEISYQQQFTFLPGFWKGFGAFANFSYTQAVGNFGSTTFQKELPNQRPRSANGGVSYVGRGINVRLLANWDGKYYRGGAAAAATYAEPRFVLDLKSQYRFNKRYSVYLDVLNLTDEYVRTAVLQGGMKYDVLRQGIVFNGGLKLAF